MIVCPVCEHAQVQGAECEVCGKRLGPAVAAQVGVTPLAELEQTSAAPTGQVAVVPFEGLDPTRTAEVQALPAAPVPDLERTRASSVAVEAAAMPELEAHREAAGGASISAAVGSGVCRYCRNVQPVGAFCERCGMKLPRPPVVAVAAMAPGQPGAVVRCKCGVRTRSGEPCSSCGVPVPLQRE
jgi:hypothetical protein